jgi:hypothetical protein
LYLRWDEPIRRITKTIRKQTIMNPLRGITSGSRVHRTIATLLGIVGGLEERMKVRKHSKSLYCIGAILLFACSGLKASPSDGSSLGDPGQIHAIPGVAHPAVPGANILLIQSSDPWENSGHYVGETCFDGITSDTMVLDRLSGNPTKSPLGHRSAAGP